MDIHVYLHGAVDDAILQKLDAISRQLAVVIEKEKQMDADIQALIDQVTADEAVESSAVAVINGIAQRIADAIAGASSLSADDRAALQTKVAEVKSSADTLAAAVAANTPAAPAAPSA